MLHSSTIFLTWLRVMRGSIQWLLLKIRQPNGIVFFLAAALVLPASAQTGEVYRIGILEPTQASMNRANLSSFLQGMQEHGYVQGKNLVLDYRSADGRPEQYRRLAMEMVRAGPAPGYQQPMTRCACQSPVCPEEHGSVWSTSADAGLIGLAVGVRRVVTMPVPRLRRRFTFGLSRPRRS